jgi:hypothetical protein
LSLKLDFSETIVLKDSDIDQIEKGSDIEIGGK